MSLLACRVSWGLALAAAVVTLIIGIVVGRGGLPHFVLGPGLAFVALLGVIPATWIAFDAARTRRRTGASSTAAEWCARIGAQTCVVLVALGVSYPLAEPLIARDLEAARQFCDRAIPRLESYSAAHGRYPESIESVVQDGEQLPRLFRDDSAPYYGSDAEYQFQLGSPARLAYVSEWNVWTKHSLKTFEADLEAVRVFCEKLALRIDAHRAQHGAYPANLRLVIDPDEELPRLMLTGEVDYYVNAAGFGFTVHDSTAFGPHGWGYDSASRTWFEWS